MEVEVEVNKYSILGKLIMYIEVNAYKSFINLISNFKVMIINSMKMISFLFFQNFYNPEPLLKLTLLVSLLIFIIKRLYKVYSTFSKLYNNTNMHMNLVLSKEKVDLFFKNLIKLKLNHKDMFYYKIENNKVLTNKLEIKYNEVDLLKKKLEKFTLEKRNPCCFYEAEVDENCKISSKKTTSYNDKVFFKILNTFLLNKDIY